MLFLTHKFFWIVFLTYNLMTFSVCYFLRLNYFWIKNMICNKHIYLFFLFSGQVYILSFISLRRMFIPQYCAMFYLHTFLKLLNCVTQISTILTDLFFNLIYSLLREVYKFVDLSIFPGFISFSSSLLKLYCSF